MTLETNVERKGPNSTNPEASRTPSTPSKSSGTALRSSGPSIPFPTPGAKVQEDGSTPSEDEDFVVVKVSIRSKPPPETPRKAAKVAVSSTPRKRHHVELVHIDDISTDTQSAFSPATFVQDGDPFVNAPNTPTPVPSLDVQSGGRTESDLAPEILRCLSNHHVLPMTSDLKDDIDAIGKRHSKSKDETIAHLKAEIDALKTEFRRIYTGIGLALGT